MNPILSEHALEEQRLKEGGLSGWGRCGPPQPPTSALTPVTPQPHPHRPRPGGRTGRPHATLSLCPARRPRPTAPPPLTAPPAQHLCFPRGRWAVGRGCTSRARQQTSSSTHVAPTSAPGRRRSRTSKQFARVYTYGLRTAPSALLTPSGETRAGKEAGPRARAEPRGRGRPRQALWRTGRRGGRRWPPEPRGSQDWALEA